MRISVSNWRTTRRTSSAPPRRSWKLLPWRAQSECRELRRRAVRLGGGRTRNGFRIRSTRGPWERRRCSTMSAPRSSGRCPMKAPRTRQCSASWSLPRSPASSGRRPDATSASSGERAAGGGRGRLGGDGRDQNGFSVVSSPAAAVAEEVAAEWVADLLGLPAGVSCGLRDGGQRRTRLLSQRRGTTCWRRPAGMSSATACRRAAASRRRRRRAARDDRPLAQAARPRDDAVEVVAVDDQGRMDASRARGACRGRTARPSSALRPGT